MWIGSSILGRELFKTRKLKEKEYSLRDSAGNVVQFTEGILKSPRISIPFVVFREYLSRRHFLMFRSDEILISSDILYGIFSGGL